MGNVCEQEGDCLQPEIRQRMRGRSLSDSKDNINLKELIQVKKFSIAEEYNLLHPAIGKGSFGNVYKALHRSSGVARAVKRLNKKQKSINSLEEYLILKQLVPPP